jgi:hypothetical protein
MKNNLIGMADVKPGYLNPRYPIATDISSNTGRNSPQALPTKSRTDSIRKKMDSLLFSYIAIGIRALFKI